MKGKMLLAGMLLAAVLLAACAPKTPPVEETKPPVENAGTTDQQPQQPQQPEDTTDPRLPAALESLTVELVVPWEHSDRILSSLQSLKSLLMEALGDQGYDLKDLTMTISTAGGLTADALLNGGVDVAILPSVDYIACQAGARAVLATTEEVCETVVAVSNAREELDEAFCQALVKILLETESGSAFLNTYEQDIAMVPATEDAIESVRQWLQEQEAATRGA